MTGLSCKPKQRVVAAVTGPSSSTTPVVIVRVPVVARVTLMGHVVAKNQPARTILVTGLIRVVAMEKSAVTVLNATGGVSEKCLTQPKSSCHFIAN